MQHFDQDNNNRISKREFIQICDRLGFSLDDAKEFFGMIDTNNNQYISAIEFKDLLESDLVNKREFYGRIREFVLNRKNQILSTLANFDKRNERVLSISQIKSALNLCGFQAAIEEIQYLCEDLKIQRDNFGNFNYQQLINTIFEKDQSKQKIQEIDNILNYLRQKLLDQPHLDLVDELNKYDRVGNHMVDFNEIFNVLARYNIYVKRDEKDLLYSLFDPKDGKVDIQEFCTIAYSGRPNSSMDALLNQLSHIKPTIL
mmetsp:Transcript_6623/g.5953  ORF Transcript_6623/g.5953 Transcript_6623/m.5953 type:complete len:258 (-) Transcript_6623:608-1381(-)